MLPKIGKVQNLVPNYSFSDYYNCPSGLGGGYWELKNWFIPSAGDPEYHNKCAAYYPNPYNNVWGNIFSSYDSAIAGFFVYQGPTFDNSEYYEIELLQSLEAGKKYTVSCLLKASKIYRSADAIDFYFSVDSLYDLGVAFFYVTPQVSNPSDNIISDSINWYVFTDTFTAAGGEKFLTIGSFRSGAVTNTLPGSTSDPRGYVFIDSVSVTLMDTTGIIDSSNCDEFNFYPNPANINFTFEICEANNEAIIISNSLGQMVKKLNATQNKIEYDLSEFAAGVYFVRYKNMTKKLMIQR